MRLLNEKLLTNTEPDKNESKKIKKKNK